MDYELAIWPKYKERTFFHPFYSSRLIVIMAVSSKSSMQKDTIIYPITHLVLDPKEMRDLDIIRSGKLMV